MDLPDQTDGIRARWFSIGCMSALLAGCIIGAIWFALH